MKAIFHRTSVREYQNREVEQEKVEKLLRAAMAAPSAGNQQPWEFYVVTDSDILKELGGSSPYAGPAGKAPLAIVPCFREDVRFPEEATSDLSAATENLLLEADYLELGAVWMALNPLEDRMTSVRKILDVPADLQPFAIIAVGYPVKVKPQQDRYDEKRVHYVR